MEELCTRTLCVEKIKLEPVYLTSNFKDEILNRLKQKVEGVCTKHGYIRKGSIELHKVSPGCVEILSLSGNINYNVWFYADVCNPLNGMIIKNAKVVNMNRFGILAEARIMDDRFATSVLEIIIAKNSVNIISEVDLDKVAIGDEVIVEILGKKFNLGDKKISAIGKILKEATKKEPRYLSKAVEDIEEGEEVIEEGEEAEVEEEEEEEEAEEEEAEEEKSEEEEEESEGESVSHGGSDFFSDDVGDDFDDAILSDEEEDVLSD